MRHLVVDQHEVEDALARASQRLDGIEESLGLDQAFGFDMTFQEIEDRAAVINEKRLGQHRRPVSFGCEA